MLRMIFRRLINKLCKAHTKGLLSNISRRFIIFHISRSHAYEQIYYQALAIAELTLTFFTILPGSQCSRMRISELITFAGSLMLPRPLIRIRQSVLASTRLREFPLGPRSRPTKLYCINRKYQPIKIQGQRRSYQKFVFIACLHQDTCQWVYLV